MNRIKQRAVRLATAVIAAGTVLGGVAFSPAANATPAAVSQPPHPVASQIGPKRKPSLIGGDAARGASPAANLDDGGCCFLYGEAHQSAVADGAYGYYTVGKPAVASVANHGTHSLAELAVSSGGSQIVEVGWIVDRNLNGDDNPHLFVYHWVDGNQSCYNGCGFVPFVGGDITPGVTLPVSDTDLHQFWIVHSVTDWLVGYDNHYLGHFPDSLWGGRFTKSDMVQWFGEVADPTTSPCTEMGNGLHAAAANAARIQNVGFYGGPTPEISIRQPTPQFYTALKTSSVSMSYGGPGSCRTVPDLRGDSRTVAANLIRAAGLVSGTVNPVTDQLCEDLNRVISQFPSPRSRVIPGARVNITYGVPPRTGCPNPRA
jgi:hypothetical protein